MTTPTPPRRPTLGELLDRAMSLAGFGCVVYGAHEVYAPAAWIVAGLALISLAVAPTSPERQTKGGAR